MTRSSLFDENWFRVRTLTPRLAPDVAVSRHTYRLQPSYILRRKSTRRWHYMSASAYELLSQFDGDRTVEQVWEKLLASQGELAPDQGDVIALLSQLHDADMLIVDSQLDARLTLDRKQRMEDGDKKQRFFNPLHIRVALMDPDSYVDRMNEWLPQRCLYPLLFCMLILFIAAGMVLAPRWPELMMHVSGNAIFDPAVVLLLVIMYPLMKLLHELGHALTIKRFGGDVREVGVAMLVLFPNPYVDASAASMFVSKYQRILVSAAGIAIELCLAAVAVLVWASSTGLLRDAALSVIILGSVSTLLFNGNPLLKFDGYYILSDWLEIPNLAKRSRQYLLGSMARVLRLETSAMPVPSDSREKLWLIAYGVLSTVYRILLMAAIAWMVSGQYFFFGVLLAVYIAFSMLVVPFWKLLKFSFKQTPQARTRLAGVAGGFALLLTGVAVAVPGPGSITTDGIVWLPEQSVLRLEQPCEVLNVVTQPGEFVEAGQHLFDCADDAWFAEEKVLKASLQKIDAQRTGLMTIDPVEYERLTSQRVAIDLQYELARSRLSAMKVVAPAAGEFLVDGTTDLVGRYISGNAIAGYIVPNGLRTIRLSLTQVQAGYLSESTTDAHVFYLDDSVQRQVAVTQIARRTPKASSTALVAALTTLGGGELRAEESDSGALLEQPVFDLELRWPDELEAQMIGSRLRVRIEHRPASISRLISEQVRNLLQQRITQS